MEHPRQSKEDFAAETKLLMKKLDELMAEFPSRQFLMFTAEPGAEVSNLCYIAKMQPGLMRTILESFIETQLGHIAPGASNEQIKTQRAKLN